MDRTGINGVLQWRKSSRSGPHGDCVELALDGPVLCVRDSKNPGGPILRLARAALVRGVHATAGE